MVFGGNSSVTEESETMTTTVHFLYAGQTPCSVVSGGPISWPAGHVWERFDAWNRIKTYNWWSEIGYLKCDECDKAVAKHRQEKKDTMKLCFDLAKMSLDEAVEYMRKNGLHTLTVPDGNGNPITLGCDLKFPFIAATKINIQMKQKKNERIILPAAVNLLLNYLRR